MALHFHRIAFAATVPITLETHVRQHRHPTLLSKKNIIEQKKKSEIQWHRILFRMPIHMLLLLLHLERDARTAETAK